MFGFHTEDLIIVLLIALVIFGPRKLPDIGSAIGKSIREFKKATTEIEEQQKSPEPKPLPSPSSTEDGPPERPQTPASPPPGAANA